MRAAIWPAKDPAEVVWASFDFAPGLDPGESVQSVTLSVSVAHGSDATPQSILDGVMQIANGAALQRLKSGVSGTAYRLRALATTSTGRVLLLSAILPVIEIN